MTGSIVLVSALLPSNAETISGNPSCSASRPIVICGSSRRSLENPGSRTSDAFRLSSGLGEFRGGEGGVLVVVLAGLEAVARGSE